MHLLATEWVFIYHAHTVGLTLRAYDNTTTHKHSALCSAELLVLTSALR